MANRCSGCGKFVPNGSRSTFVPDSAWSSESLDFYCDPCFEDNARTYNRIVYGHPDGPVVGLAKASPQRGGESGSLERS